MYVRILRHANGWTPGRILNAPDGVANLLLSRRVAEPWEAPQEEPTDPDPVHQEPTDPVQESQPARKPRARKPSARKPRK